MSDDPQTLVSTDWLERHLKDPDLRIFDASWYLPTSGRDPKAEYDRGHIPGARFFDNVVTSAGASVTSEMNAIEIAVATSRPNTIRFAM